MTRRATVQDLRDAESALGGLGGLRRECADCGALVEPPKACPQCGSWVFTEVVLEARPVEFGALGKIVQAMRPAKPAAPTLTPEDTAMLARAAATARAFLAALSEADQVTRRATNAGVEVGYLQFKLATAIGDPNDSVSIDGLKPFAKSVEALAQLLETTLAEQGLK